MKRATGILISIISALIIGVGTFSSYAGFLGLSETLAGDIPKILPDYSSSAQITPEIRELLQKNNLRPAQYKTPAPDFALQDLDGNEVRLNQFRGETVLLGFFTTW